MPPSPAKKSASAKKAPPASKADAEPAKVVSPAKKSFDIKFAKSKKTGNEKKSECTVLNAVLISERGKGSKQGIVFYLKRVDGDTLSCWADKTLADLVYQGNTAIIDDCHVQQKIFKLHDAEGVPLKGHKGYGRRCYVVVVDELPDDDTIRELMDAIVEEVNKFPTMKESQKAVVPNEFIVERGVPFVAKLANEQTIGLCENVLLVPLAELQSYFCVNTAAFANFWHEGTMTAKVAAFFGAGSEWIMPSELH